MVAGSTQSRKNKSRTLQKQGAMDIIHCVGEDVLTKDDVWSTSMGKSGIDIGLSTKARSIFPFACECKRKEKINVHGDFEQTRNNAQKEGLTPLLITKRNREEILVTMQWSVFLRLFERLYILESLVASQNGLNVKPLREAIKEIGAQYSEYIEILSQVENEVDTYIEESEKMA
jgi:hypothetical protein